LLNKKFTEKKMKKRDGATKKYDKKVNIKFFYVVPECDVVA
jgi:hypothetical protein